MTRRRRTAGLALAGLTVVLVAACDSAGPGPVRPTTAALTTTAAAPPPRAPTAVAASAPVPSAGCAAPPAIPPGATDRTLDVDGTARTWWQYRPPDVPATRPLPVVLDLHGLGSNALGERVLTGFEDLGARQHFMVLTPQGAGSPPRWDYKAGAGNGDVRFLGLLLDRVERDSCVDTSRVYATGLSNGAIEAAVLACRFTGRIAAVGLASGIVPPDRCDSARAVPIMVFWGRRDVVLPYYGGLGDGLRLALGAKVPQVLRAPTAPPGDLNGFPPVELVVSTWVRYEGCAARPRVYRMGSDVQQRAYGGCRNGASIRFYVVADGGHTWPGSRAMRQLARTPAGRIIGVTTDQVDATTLIWSFLRGYTAT